MSVFDNNQQHLHNVPTNVGEVTLIHVARQNRPAGLKKPYEYVLSIEQVNALFDELKALIKPGNSKGLQCAGLWKKATTKGIRLNVFCLGFRVGLCGDHPDNARGVTAEYWTEICEGIQNILQKFLGEDAKIYAEPYVENEPAMGHHKFQARFETYIMYSAFHNAG